MARIAVKRQVGGTWGVFVDGKLVEGGFFSKAAAEMCADRQSGQADDYGVEPATN